MTDIQCLQRHCDRKCGDAHPGYRSQQSPTYKWRFYRRKRLPGFALTACFILVVFALAMIHKLYATYQENQSQVTNEEALGQWETSHRFSHVSGIYDVHSSYGRKLLMSELNCTPPAVEGFPRGLFTQAERQQGAVILHVILGTYMFLAIAITCDHYFVPACERFCNFFDMSDDVAGATFMAAGCSAPEMAITFIGVFITKNDIGLGTVVGSEVFNMLFVVSLCALFAGKDIELRWWPLARDCLSYTVSIISLVLIVYDEFVYWYEGLVLLLMYVAYVILVYFNRSIEATIVQHIDLTPCRRCSSGIESVPLKSSTAPTNNNNMDYENGSNEPTSDGDLIEDVQEPWVLAVPETRCKRALWVITLPLTLLMFVTIPDCRQPRWKKWYGLTFFMSCVWLGAFSYLMTWMITVAGYTMHIPDTVMGLTFLAAGASLPDAVSSLIVAREGLGDMALSNAFGSNVIDILICLGLPWFIQTCMVDTSHAIRVYSESLTRSAMTLVTTVVLILVLTHLNRWRLTKIYGIILMVGYILFVVLASLYEVNIFGDAIVVPMCPSDY